MIQFQFPDSCLVFENDLFVKLKSKLRQSNNRIEYAFTTSHENETKQWEIVSCPKTHQVKSVQYIKSHVYNHFICGTLYDEKTNALVYCNGEYIYILYIDNGKTEQMTKENMSTLKFYSNQTNKKFLLGICEMTGSFKVWDWETKQLVKTENSSKDLYFHIQINEQTQEFIGYGHFGVIQVWCLETFTCKREIGKDFKLSNLKSLRFLNYSKEWLVGTSGAKIRIWSKRDEKFLCEYDTGKLRLWYFVCSIHLGLIILGNGSGLLVLKFDIKKCQLKSEFEIANPFEQQVSNFKFLDPNTQTQLLVIDMCGNFFVLNLLSKEITGKTKGLDGTPCTVMLI